MPAGSALGVVVGSANHDAAVYERAEAFVLDGLPSLRLDPDAPPPVIEGLAFRGPAALPVVFDAC